VVTTATVYTPTHGATQRTGGDAPTGLRQGRLVYLVATIQVLLGLQSPHHIHIVPAHDPPKHPFSQVLWD
jgi:hypothetical protein